MMQNNYGGYPYQNGNSKPGVIQYPTFQQKPTTPQQQYPYMQYQQPTTIQKNNGMSYSDKNGLQNPNIQPVNLMMKGEMVKGAAISGASVQIKQQGVILNERPYSSQSQKVEKTPITIQGKPVQGAIISGATVPVQIKQQGVILNEKPNTIQQGPVMIQGKPISGTTVIPPGAGIKIKQGDNIIDLPPGAIIQNPNGIRQQTPFIMNQNMTFANQKVEFKNNPSCWKCRGTNVTKKGKKCKYCYAANNICIKCGEHTYYNKIGKPCEKCNKTSFLDYYDVFNSLDDVMNVQQ